MKCREAESDQPELALVACHGKENNLCMDQLLSGVRFFMIRQMKIKHMGDI
jgi:hypothetical protein